MTKGDFAKYAEQFNKDMEMDLITRIRNYEERALAEPIPRSPAAQKLINAAENLLIAIGMGWDLEGCAENLRAALAQSDAEPRPDASAWLTETADISEQVWQSLCARPDASAGLIEAAEWHEEKAEDCEAGAKRDPRNKIPHLISAKRHREAAKYFRTRAADRSGK